MEYRGYTIIQSEYNHHIQICDDTHTIAHINCSKHLEGEELKAIADRVLKLRDKPAREKEVLKHSPPGNSVIHEDAEDTAHFPSKEVLDTMLYKREINVTIVNSDNKHTILDEDVDFKGVISQIDAGIEFYKKFLFANSKYISVILPGEYSLDMRNKLAMEYLDTYQYIYHQISSDNNDSYGLSEFIFSNIPLGDSSYWTLVTREENHA